MNIILTHFNFILKVVKNFILNLFNLFRIAIFILMSFVYDLNLLDGDRSAFVLSCRDCCKTQNEEYAGKNL